MGGLCFPSEDVFKICIRSETIINNHIKEKVHIILPNPKDIELIKNRILKSFISCNDIFASLNSHSLEQNPTSDHRLHLICAVIEKFINVRVHFAYKSNPVS